ncbi:MAG TPA: hypothetical protein VGI87_01065 [Solirubrobacteraceae bacterium]
MRMAPRSFIAVGIAGAAIVLGSGCGVTGASDAQVMTGTSASCAGLKPSLQYSQARLVVLANALAGPTARRGAKNVLLSPARMRIIRYLKGHGRSTITVQTAVTKHGTTVTESEDAIEPVAGQRWHLFLTGRRQPYRTSICAGSRRVGSARQ